LLTGKPGITDYHNALKSGYDVENLAWPDWVTALPGGHWQQKVLSPGEAIGTVSPESAKHFNLNPACVVRAGTTDSIAAFIASGASRPGEAVTSLGTTLVLKLLSAKRVDDPASGVYSHRFGKLWLAGGASNSGGGVLKQYFSSEELIALSAVIDPDQPSGLDYYPLPKPGERFPINDPQLLPRMEPRPKDDAMFLHGLLESMAKIEAMGYRKLEELGASPLKQVITAGGGAQNETWRRIRENLLGVPVTTALHSEAAIGTAQLARLGKVLLPA
jgi:sugar (pentulose or hexulose) kinase